MKRYAFAIFLVALGFFSSLEISSRCWWFRLPQWDDRGGGVTLEKAPHEWPEVETPLGGKAPLCSVTIMPASTDPLATAIYCDSLSCVTSIIYTYDGATKRWHAWTPMRLYDIRETIK